MLKIETFPEGVAREQLAPSVLLTRRTTFAAAHVLRRDDWDEAENRRVFGACAGDHGHNYILEVSISGDVDPSNGMVINLKDLDRVVKAEIIELVDHKHLNHDVEFLAGVLPTAENLAVAFWNRLQDRFGRRRCGESNSLRPRTTLLKCASNEYLQTQIRQ